MGSSRGPSGEFFKYSFSTELSTPLAQLLGSSMLTYSFDEGTAEVWNSTRCDNIHTLVHHSVRELALCKRHGGEDALHGECVNG